MRIARNETYSLSPYPPLPQPSVQHKSGQHKSGRYNTRVAADDECITRTCMHLWQAAVIDVGDW